MPDRFVEIVVPADQAERLRDLLSRDQALESWHEPRDDMAVFKLVIPAEGVEAILDPLQAAFSSAEGFRVVVLPVEASLPRREKPKSEETEIQVAATDAAARSERISREELYEDLSRYARVSRVFVSAVILSTIVAAIGIARSSPAIVIGAVVIAPLLGPNVALALATRVWRGGP